MGLILIHTVGTLNGSHCECKGDGVPQWKGFAVAGFALGVVCPERSKPPPMTRTGSPSSVLWDVKICEQTLPGPGLCSAPERTLK